jgi:hypothetical protein
LQSLKVSQKNIVKEKIINFLLSVNYSTWYGS